MGNPVFLILTASLQAFESIEGTIKASFDGCLVAQKAVQRGETRNGLLSSGNFR